jgi:NTE family protein
MEERGDRAVSYAPIVLSGGGVRGAAHAGVLRALAERGILPEAISGTSAGALVGALVADGHAPQDLVPMVREELKRTRLWRWPRSGSQRLAAFLKAHLRAKRIEDLSIPMYITATDLERGGQRIFTTGELVPALLASSAVPIVFPPVRIDGTYYVDGGLSNNLPVEPFAHRKQDVVAVYVNPLSPFVPGKQSLLGTMDRIWHINFREMVMRSAQGCRWFIEPPDLTFGMFDLRKLARAEDIGYTYARDLPLPA